MVGEGRREREGEHNGSSGRRGKEGARGRALEHEVRSGVTHVQDQLGLDV